LAVLLVLGLWVVGAVAAAATFEAQGRVAALDSARGAVTLEHAGIAGLLPATRSEFPVASAGLLEGVRIGDRVRFTLAAADESHGLLTVASLTPEGAGGAAWPDRLMTIAAAVLALAAVASVAVVGVLLWRAFQTLDRRIVALDHETSMLRGDVADTQDGIRQLARALEDAATTLRVGYVRDLHRRLATTPTGSAPAGSASSDPDRSLVVVQRGRGDLYQAVVSGAVGPGCTAMWDRRRGERRAGGRHAAAPERRKAERRASLPESWARLGFHIVPGAHAAESPRGVRPLRPAGEERGAAR
jgi:Cu/Ag efflux protein CusF